MTAEVPVVPLSMEGPAPSGPLRGSRRPPGDGQQLIVGTSGPSLGGRRLPRKTDPPF